MNLEYSFIQRMIHRLFATKSLFRFIGYYGLVNILIIMTGLTFIDVLYFNMKSFTLESSGALISVQAGVLGVISIALALVTIIAPKNNEISIIEIYYHESRAFEIIVSSFALLSILSIQVFAPIQTIAVLFGIENTIPFLSVIPFFWLMINLFGISHFIMTTLDFVNPAERRIIRKRFTKNFIQSDKQRNSHLPAPNRILNEMAIKSVSKIDQNDLVEFKIVWREMVEYHCFLLSLIVEQNKNCDSTSFATGIDCKFMLNFDERTGEITYNPGHEKHYVYVEWREQYDQLFKRAIDKIPVENGFVKILADTPKHLLSIPDGSHLSREIIMDILELIPSLMQYMGKWMYKRAIFNLPNAKGCDGGFNDLLPNMEAGIYKESVQFIIEKWKEITSSTMGSLYGKYIFRTKTDNWNTFKNSWYFQREHLFKSADMLIFATLQHDDVAVYCFQKILLEWKENVPYQWSEPSKPVHFLPFDIIDKDWSDIKKQEKLLLNDSSIQPRDIYLNIINNTHQDILLIISALLIYWLNREKRSSEIECDIVIKFLDKLQNGPDLYLCMLRFILIEFNVIFVSDDYKCDKDRYKENLRNIMRYYNEKKCSDFYCRFDEEYEKGKHEWKQIIEASVIIFAGRFGFKKKDFERNINKINEINETNEENNYFIDDFIDYLEEIKSKLKNPSRYISALTSTGYKGNFDDALNSLNALHDRISEIKCLVISTKKCDTCKSWK